MYENIENDKMFIDKSLENFFESVPASKINSGALAGTLHLTVGIGEEGRKAALLRSCCQSTLPITITALVFL